MPNTTVIVEVLNLATFKWATYGFAGSRPGYTLAEADNECQVWFANNNVRFPQHTH